MPAARLPIRSMPMPFGRFELQISVIVNTYNNPSALALVLAGLQRQTEQRFEVLVADDGSKPETGLVIKQFAVQTEMPVVHVWHEDDGFRRCTILNKAILAARGNYLVFLDGDCIPMRRAVAVHAHLARPGTSLGGGKSDLDEAVVRELTPAAVVAGVLDPLPPRWWRLSHVRRYVSALVPGLGSLMDVLQESPNWWPGESSSLFAADMRRVRGFDERFTYGYEEFDLGHRLTRAGIRTRSVRYRAPVYHLPHGRPYRNEDAEERNRQMFLTNCAKGLPYTAYGLPPVDGGTK